MNKVASIKSLLREKGICKYERVSVCGIYFLVLNESVVYVGQSIDIYSRTGNHSDKLFNDIYIIECKQEKLNELEKHFILKYQPIYNKQNCPGTKLLSFWERKNLPVPESMKRIVDDRKEIIFIGEKQE